MQQKNSEIRETCVKKISSESCKFCRIKSEGIDIGTALDRAVCRDLGSTRAVLASIEDMILLKEKTDRAQDKADIDHLRRLRGEKI